MDAGVKLVLPHSPCSLPGDSGAAIPPVVAKHSQSVLQTWPGFSVDGLRASAVFSATLRLPLAAKRDQGSQGGSPCRSAPIRCCA